MSNNFIAHLDNPSHPFLTCDNWFTPEEEQMVWKELDLYTSESTLDHASKGPVAKNEEGEILASNFRIYPDMIYNEQFRNMSPILRGKEEKLSTWQLKDFITNNMLPGPFGQFAGTNADSSLVSYYHKGDYYKPHFDTFQFTILIWFYKEPKAFTGGDFHFTDAKISVPCVHNRMIIFPSYLKHAVTPLEFEEEKSLGWGRYTITHFFYSVPNTNYTPPSERKDNG